MRISDWSSDVCSSDLEKISEQRSVVARDRPQGQAQPRSGHHLGEGRDIGHTITSSSMLVHTERTISFRHHRARRCAYERNSAAWSARLTNPLLATRSGG